jgi:nucleoside-diphosphate-sugar epimerase
MKIVVTGGTGFVGKHLALTLKQLGEEVKVIGRNGSVGETLRKQGIDFQLVDLTDLAQTTAALKDIDLVYHCAALSSVWGRYQDFYRANVLGTRHVIQGCLANGVSRMVYISTSSVYFDFKDRLNISEDAAFGDPVGRVLPYRQVNDYTTTKKLAELEVQKAININGLLGIIIRPRGIFGPGDTALFPRLLRASQTTGIPLIRGGHFLMDLTYIDNLISALLLCRARGNQLNGQIYNISNGEPIYFHDLLKSIDEHLTGGLRLKPMPRSIATGIATCLELGHRALGLTQEPLLTRYTVGVLGYSQTLNIQKAKTELGYHPAVSLATGIARSMPDPMSPNEKSPFPREI